MPSVPCLIAACLLGATPPADAPSPADPVISWARVEFDAEGITSAEAGGLADIETGRHVTVGDPVRMASVTKLVTAIGVMRLVAAGTLDLDTDVSDYLGWRLRNPAFPDTPITLRHLLGHRAGVRDAAGYALPLDADLEDWMRQEGAWEAEYPPGAWFDYVNLNFAIVAAAMEGATGERFDRIMAREVFEPLGLDACYNWTTCSTGRHLRAVTLYRPDGSVARDSRREIAEGCPVTPAADGSCDLAIYRLAHNGSAFTPQGGMRISPRDLARIGMMILGDDDSFLPAGIRARFLDAGPIFAPDAGESSYVCAYGLAVQALASGSAHCSDDLFGDGRARTGHLGIAYGLRSGFWLAPADSERPASGVIYFVTGLPASPARGHSRFTAAEEALARGLPVDTYIPARPDE